MKRLQSILACFLVSVVAGCAGAARLAPGTGAPNEREANLRMLMRLDGNNDGALARAEFDQALRNDFALVDRNTDGKLDPGEASVENNRRWQADGPEASPLFDWNQDSSVDYVEFANAPLGMFNLLDWDRDGQLSVDELQVLARAIPRAAAPDARPGRGPASGPPVGGR